jgi:beta-N-acetylhexosaminidase
MRALLWILLCLIPLASLAAEPEPKKSAKETKAEPAPPVELTKDGEKWAEKTLKKLSVEEKVGQLIMTKAFAEFDNDENPAYQQVRDEVKKFHLGSVLMTVRVDGPFLLRNQPYEAAMMANRLQSESELPLLVAADFERGLSMRLMATPMFPHAMAFGATGKPEYGEQFGKIVARESRAIGVHWNFFPVADVNSNPLNPIINTRSYGEDPQLVGDFVAAVVKGSREGGMLSTAKHFPGHGDTDVDSHLAVGRVGGSVDRLNTVELPPFQRAIDAGVDAVMVAHVTVPAIEPDPNKVATLSSRVIGDILMKQMKFSGLVVTDAMDMKGLTLAYKGMSPGAAAGKAAVDALLAGNDMILWPSDLEGAYNGILNAVKYGEISMEALDSRVLRVLQAKGSLGLHKQRLVDVSAISQLVGEPQDMALAQEIAENAVTLVRNSNKALDLFAQEKTRKRGTSAPSSAYDDTEAAGTGTFALIITDDVRSDWGRTFERELRARIPDVNVMFVDERIANEMLEPVTEAALGAQQIVVAAYAAPSAGRRVEGSSKGSVGLAGGTASLVERVLKVAPEKTAMIALGNPYVASSFPGVKTYLCTFSNAPTSEIAAVKALMGEIATHGKLPVSIPNIAQRGEGLERPLAATAAGK